MLYFNNHLGTPGQRGTPGEKGDRGMFDILFFKNKINWNYFLSGDVGQQGYPGNVGQAGAPVSSRDFFYKKKKEIFLKNRVVMVMMVNQVLKEKK